MDEAQVGRKNQSPALLSETTTHRHETNTKGTDFNQVTQQLQPLQRDSSTGRTRTTVAVGVAVGPFHD